MFRDATTSRLPFSPVSASHAPLRAEKVNSGIERDLTRFRNGVRGAGLQHHGVWIAAALAELDHLRKGALDGERSDHHPDARVQHQLNDGVVKDEGVERDQAKDRPVNPSHDDPLELYHLLDWGVTRPASGRDRSR